MPPAPRKPPQYWAMPRDWKPAEATGAGPEDVDRPENEPVCAVQPESVVDLKAEQERDVDSANLNVGPDPTRAPGTPAMQVQVIDLADQNPALLGRIQAMLAKHVAMWSGERLEVIKTTEHCI